MKDDIADVRNQSIAPVVDAGKKVSKQPAKKELSPIPQGATKARKIIPIISLLVIFGIIVTGGWFAYRSWQTSVSPQSLTSKLLEISEVIPKSALSVVIYDLSTDANRSTVTSLWSSHPSEGANNPTTGDPTALVGIADIDHIYFFTQPNDSSPFIVVQDTQSTKQFFSQLSGVKYVENGGWIVAHVTTIDQYIAESKKENFAVSADASLVGGTGFVVRYIISPTALPQIFSLSSNIVLNRQQLVFDITDSAQPGVLQGAYRISEQAVSATVIPDIAQLTALIPTDPGFLRVGTNFFTDISSFQQSHAFFDAGLFDEPAVQQLIAKLTTPYAWYTRTGSDGVPDTGLIIQLPTELHASLGHKNQVVEDLLSSFAPFVTGRPLNTQIVFADNAYSGAPIRFANLEGQTAALDYSIGDNFILISSSREGMYALSDMTRSSGSSMMQHDPWVALMQAAQALVPTDMVIGSIKDPAMLSLFPGNAVGNMAAVLVSTKKDNTGINTHATILFTK